MCLGIPMELVRKESEGVGIVRLGGLERKVSLALVNNVEIGNYLIVHAGFAITVLDAEEARKTLQLLQEVFGDELPLKTPPNPEGEG
jgi:hydrogenase expression/formation protein HypC